MLSTNPDGSLKAFGLVGSIISNITWAMGINMKVQLTRDGFYGMIGPDGSFHGTFKDLLDEVCIRYDEESNIFHSQILSSSTFIAFDCFIPKGVRYIHRSQYKDA